MKYSGSKKRLFNRQFWKTIENKNYALFLTAVFFTFLSLGFVSDVFNNLQYSYPTLIYNVIFTSLIATAFAYAGTRHLRLFPVLIVVEIIYMFFLRYTVLIDLTPDMLEIKSTIVGLGILISVLLGYIFFVIFIKNVGINHFLMKAEMELAKKIHEVLVPEINVRNQTFDIYGKSIPTNEVGGDLIDVVTRDDQQYCYIADVSGHGVSSGVYTGMFKSSVRSMLNNNSSLDKLVTNVNETLSPMTKKNMFISAAMIKLNGTKNAEFIIAGHLPLLHFNKKENRVEELMIKQIPVGFNSEFQYISAEVDYNEGDIFALITDGITETSDKNEKQFGMERVKELIKSANDKSAEEITETILDEVKNFGIQKDDITLLIIKC